MEENTIVSTNTRRRSLGKMLLKVVGFFLLIVTITVGILFFTVDNPTDFIRYNTSSLRGFKCSFINNASSCVKNGCRVVLDGKREVYCRGTVSPGGLPNCYGPAVEPAFKKCVSN